MINTLCQLELEARTGVDFYAEASRLPYVDTLKIAEQHDHVLIKAEYGCGKTFSLKPIADKTLYIAHRRVLVDQNSHFAKACTINALPSVNVNDYEYIVIDEALGTLAGLSWEQVDYRAVLLQLSLFEGKIIALDRDGSPAISQLLSKLTDKQFSFYHHETGSRNKSVLLTESIDEMLDLAMKAPAGIKLILCDTKSQAESLHKLKLDQPKFLITASTGNAMDIIKEAENCGDCWLFASPKIQEGVSLEGHRYVFTAYVQNGTPGMLTPVWRGQQALHRVRNLSACRVVCLLGHCQEPLINADELKPALLAQYVKAKDLVFEMLKYQAEGGTLHSYINEVVDIGFSIYSYLKQITSEHNADPLKQWIKELESSGYNVVYSDGLDQELTLEYEEMNQEYGSFDIMLSEEDRKFLKANTTADFLESYGLADNQLNRTRLRVLKHYDIAKANDLEFVSRFWQDGCYGKIRKRVALVSNSTVSNFGSLFYMIDKAVLQTTRAVLKQSIGDDWIAFGSPCLKDSFVVAKADVYRQAEFAELKQLTGNARATDERWFWQLLRKSFGLDSSRYGKDKDRYKISNDIDIDLKPQG